MKNQLRYLSFSTNSISKTALQSVLLAAITLVLAFAGMELLKPPSLATAPNSNKARNAKQSGSSASHRLVAAYYSVKGNLKATLMISNQGPNSMPVQISLFSRDGFQSDVPAITLRAHEVKAIDLRQHINPGSSFEEGSVQVVYQGRPLELGGVVTLVDSTKSLIFDEELTEPAKAFASSRLEGVWWRPTGATEVRLALSNITNSQLLVTVQTRGEGQGNSDSKTLTLGAHETRVLSTENRSGADELNLYSVAGGISINHSGAPGALVAYGQVEEAAKGFSNVIDFADPQTMKSTRLDGAGLRFGTISGQGLSPVAVVRNIATSPTTVNGRIPYTLANGDQSIATVPAFQLAPGEVKKVNLPVISQSAQVTAAGLEFVYSGSPGSVIASALSLSSNRSHVFRVPMRDAQVQSSSTGHYPWGIDDSSSTIAYIKNTTDGPTLFTISVVYDGGMYALGDKAIPGGQTLIFDVRELRDSQRPNANGSVIPLGAARGQIHWSIQGQEAKSLIGRAEQIDIANGLSMTSACGLCCPDNLYDSFIDPDVAVRACPKISCPFHSIFFRGLMV